MTLPTIAHRWTHAVANGAVLPCFGAMLRDQSQVGAAGSTQPYDAPLGQGFLSVGYLLWMAAAACVVCGSDTPDPGAGGLSPVYLLCVAFRSGFA